MWPVLGVKWAFKFMSFDDFAHTYSKKMNTAIMK